MSKPTAKTSELSCGDKIIRQIEKQLRKGHVEGVLFDSCLSCEDAMRRISMSAAHVQVYGSGVRWKSYGGSGGMDEGSKIRK